MNITISKWGSGIGLRIPVEVIKSLELQAGDQVSCELKDSGLFVRKQQSTVTMFEQFYGKPFAEITQADLGNAEEIDWGEDVGGAVMGENLATRPKMIYNVYPGGNGMKTISLSKWGNSVGLRIPEFVLNSLDITANDKVDVSVTEDSFVVKKSASKPSCVSFLEDFYGLPYEEIVKMSLKEEEIDWGPDVGEEVLI